VQYEAQFFEDMSLLRVRKPSSSPRATEHMDEIIAFVARLIKRGFAYAAGTGNSQSVYFDVKAFKAAGHTYGKLKPWAVGSAELASEGEADFTTSEKRSDQDFALWKASKAGEPFWESPWGKGRPGWHVECSAMVHAAAGGKLDIHSGGDDLRFPHHDNEIAQSEAHACGVYPWLLHLCHKQKHKQIFMASGASCAL
jgi:cysteinyl-tRNA synthetase